MTLSKYCLFITLVAVCTLQELPQYLCKLGVTFQKGESLSLCSVCRMWCLSSPTFTSLQRSQIPPGPPDADLSCLYRVFLWGGRGQTHASTQGRIRCVSSHPGQHWHQGQQWHTHQEGVHVCLCGAFVLFPQNHVWPNNINICLTGIVTILFIDFSQSEYIFF